MPSRSAASVDFMVGAVVDASNATIGIDKPMPTNKVELSFAYPNPTSGLTAFNFTLSETANVTYSLSNVIGQKVEVQNFGKVSSGSHNIKFNTANLNAGIYFYTLEVDGEKFTRKLIVE